MAAVSRATSGARATRAGLVERHLLVLQQWLILDGSAVLGRIAPSAAALGGSAYSPFSPTGGKALVIGSYSKSGASKPSGSSARSTPWASLSQARTSARVTTPRRR
jgi:hypothetical protein